MAGVETVLAVALIFWLGYERFVEKLVDPIIFKNIPSLEKYKGSIVYLGALIIGVLFFFADLRFLELLFSELGLNYSNIAWLIDLGVTPLIYASGPDILHQIMSLIQTTKENQKINLTKT